MFKLVVLTTLLAAVAAQATLGYPYGYGSALAYNGGYYPYSAYSQYPYYNSPLASTYAAPLAAAVAPAVAHVPYSPAHLIKKRSLVAAAPVVAPTSYIASSPYVSSPYYSGYSGYPYASNYLARAAPLASAYSYASPLVTGVAPLASTYSYTSPLVSSAVAPVHYPSHLIKKRSVVAAAPVVSAPLTTPVVSAPLAAPVVSAPLTAAYVAPRSFLPTTYADAAYTYGAGYTNAFATPYYNNYGYNYASPLSYSSPLYYKK